MPHAHHFFCNTCDFDLSWRFQTEVYVEDDDGNRISCNHPFESYDITCVLRKSKKCYLRRERVGAFCWCICLDCFHETFELDLGDRCLAQWALGYAPTKPVDQRKCPNCSSESVVTFFELVGKPCPKCHDGIILVEESGWII